MDIANSYKSLFTKQNYVSREEWKAAHPKIKKTIKPPVPYVVLNYTNSLGCEFKEECITRVQDIQTCQMATCKMTDIKANFLIGGDGRVYEGRGWKHYPQKYERYHKLQPINNKFIEIAFICKNGDRPTEDMQKAAAMVIQEGINRKVLATNTKVTTVWPMKIVPKELTKIASLKISRHVANNKDEETNI